MLPFVIFLATISSSKNEWEKMVEIDFVNCKIEPVEIY